MKYDTYWAMVVADIRKLSKALYGYPWSHEKIGKEMARHGSKGMSRTAVWRLEQPKYNPHTWLDNFPGDRNEHHLAEPKFSEGIALSMLLLELLEQWKVEKEEQAK